MIKQLNDEDLNQMTFKVGDVVAGVDWDYDLVGVIVSAFWKVSGQHRYIVENGIGLLHIFSEDKLKKVAGQ